jgi:branched-chain amino acid transport system ATP-binding protein
VNKLETKNLTKYFGGIIAVNDCSFTVQPKSIVSIIGPNGSGKTTIFNLISGIITPTQGEIIFNGDISIIGMKLNKITEIGIGRTFQNIRLFKETTVLESVKIGQHCRSRSGIMDSLLRLKSQILEEKTILSKAMDCLAFVGLDKYQNNLALNLSYGDQRRLEIARALATDPKLLMLDEPNSGMNTKETMDLVKLIAKIKELDITVLIISHHMKFVQSISDEVIVLNYGRIIANGNPETVIKNPLVIEAYLGKGRKECLY